MEALAIIQYLHDGAAHTTTAISYSNFQSHSRVGPKGPAGCGSLSSQCSCKRKSSLCSSSVW